MYAPQKYRWEFLIRVPRDRLWNYVADTERINRVAGVFDVEYRYEPQPGGGSIVHARGRAKGLVLEWIERPCQWVVPERFQFRRDYSRGPLAQLVSTCELLDAEEQGVTRLVHTIEVTPKSALGALVARFSVGVETRRGFKRAYGAAETWYRSGSWPDLGAERPHMSARARRELETTLQDIGRTIDAPDVARELASHLMREPDSETAVLYPYRLADRLHVERGATLRLLLRATEAGLFDMHWKLICPSCRRTKASFSSIAKLTSSGHCDACNVEFGVEFDRAVEVAFSPAPLGLGTAPKEYCHAGPMNTPHWIAGCSVPAAERTLIEVDVTPGHHRLLSTRAATSAHCDVVADGRDLPRRAHCVVTPEGVIGLPERLPAGRLSLEIENRCGDEAAQCLLERSEWNDAAATAAEITAMGEFRDLFGAEVLAPGAEFSIRNLTFLFTDLVGSTAMYESIGDAPAFALVRKHFDLLGSICREHRGALVKTIGDAVMAVFRDPDEAVAAACEMNAHIAEVRDDESGVVLALRIGLHRGACIAVEANGTLDYFGTTVNTAARIQGTAAGGEIAFCDAMLSSPAISALLAEHAARVRTEDLTLKGLAHPVRVWRVALGA